MGKTGKWLRFLLGSKKSSAKSQKGKSVSATKSTDKPGNSKNGEELSSSPFVEGLDANKHAIAVAAATAAVAEAALAAAQAAAEVVRLTSGGGISRNSAAYVSSERRRVVAAVIIQSAFRAYLAKRALKALKGLVKLQALVRGHIVRKQTANMLRRMQAMARIQARASAHRSYVSDSYAANIRFSSSRQTGVSNQRIFEHRQTNPKHNELFLKQYSTRSRMSNDVEKETTRVSSNWLDHWMEQCSRDTRQNTASFPSRHGDDDRTDKILEIDTWKPHQHTLRNDRSSSTSENFQSWNDMAQEYSKIRPYPSLSAKLQKPNPSASSEEVSPVISPNFTPQTDQIESSPRVHSASSRPNSNLRGTFTPMRSECARSVFGDYLSHPSYMANTESSRAKIRSQSVPKQRMQFEELENNTKLGRYRWDSDAYSEKGSFQSNNYMNNTFLNSNHLKRQLAAARGVGLSTSYGHIL